MKRGFRVGRSASSQVGFYQSRWFHWMTASSNSTHRSLAAARRLLKTDCLEFLNTRTKSPSVYSALQVIQHMNQGMSVTAACREVGIPRSTCYILQKNPIMMAEVQGIIYASNIQQLWLIHQNRTEILCKVIADGLSDETKPGVSPFSSTQANAPIDIEE